MVRSLNGSDDAHKALRVADSIAIKMAMTRLVLRMTAISRQVPGSDSVGPPYLESSARIVQRLEKSRRKRRDLLRRQHNTAWALLFWRSPSVNRK
jgi:hypothetical protein